MAACPWGLLMTVSHVNGGTASATVSAVNLTSTIGLVSDSTGAVYCGSSSSATNTAFCLNYCKVGISSSGTSRVVCSSAVTACAY
jgi:3-mercaptopyruvate sulfurtransferase SseA